MCTIDRSKENEKKTSEMSQLVARRSFGCTYVDLLQTEGRTEGRTEGVG
jgi:hypothetical protein